jgi:hypothetical protein
MKTFNRILVVAGLVCTGLLTASASTFFPGGDYIKPKTKISIKFEQNHIPSHISVADNTKNSVPVPEDTILVNLGQDRIVEAFPTTSRDCILNQVPYPEFARKKQLEGGVTVRFQFDEYGTVTVLESCSNSPELEQYVRDKMNYLQLKNCVVDVNRDYYMRMMVRLL